MRGPGVKSAGTSSGGCGAGADAVGDDKAGGEEGAEVAGKTEEPAMMRVMNRAGGQTRTDDLLITNQLHYLLCYTSELRLNLRNSNIVK